MNRNDKTKYVVPQALPVHLEQELCIAQSGNLGAFENNPLIDETFPALF